ncbi:MAG: family metallopeptidase [Flaviaesturariibacter sp.]|nr:family metallopeptidase [Flaviaesturariibacter sp.]
MKKQALLLLLAVVSLVSMSFRDPHTRKSPARSVSRTLAFPVAGTKSHIRDKWGASRGGGIRRHKGIDIHARKGTPVVAVCDGVIVTRDHTPIGGNTLWLKSPNQSWTAYYAHLDKQLVREGQHVKKGQVIGTVGNTGNARTTPSHLHFGVTQGHSWVNPLPYVKYAPKVAAVSPAAKKKASKKSRRRSR